MSCYKRVVAVFILAGISICSLAAEEGITWMAEQRKNTEVAIDRAKNAGWLDGIATAQEQQIERYKEVLKPQAKAQATQIVESSKRYFQQLQNETAEPQARLKQQMPKPPEPKVDLTIFLSFSMPKVELRAALATASEIGARVVIRGFEKESNNLIETLKRLKGLTKDMDPEPLVQLDPPRFRKYGVQRVPVMVYKQGESEFKVTGSLAATWLMDKASGLSESADFGRRGPTYEIQEQDLIELARDRFNRIDWKEKQKKAYERFWDNQTFHWLPVAEKPRRYWLDPTVEVISPVLNARGDVIFDAGRKLNPLDEVPTELHIALFDATKPEQLNWAVQQVNKWKTGRIIAVSTQFDRSNGKGWKHLQKVRNRLGLDVKLLTKNMMDTFQLKHAPAVIETDGKYIRIQEIGAQELSSKEPRK